MIRCLFIGVSRICYREIAAASKWISKSGDDFLYVIVGLLLSLMEKQYGSQFALTLLLAFAIELPAYLVYKDTVKRNRPADSNISFSSLLKPSDKFSFPSGHTAAAFLFASIIAFYYPKFTGLAYTLAFFDWLLQGNTRRTFPHRYINGHGVGAGQCRVGPMADSLGTR